MSEQNKVDQAAYEAMRKAHAFCPSELSHLEKMRWMADYFLKNYNSQSPALIPEQVAQAFGIEGLTSYGLEYDHSYDADFMRPRVDGNYYLVSDVDRLLATQSAKQDAQPAEARGECEHYGTARPLHLLTRPVAEKGMAEGKKKEAAEPLRQLLIDLSNNTYFCGLHLADDAKYAAYLQEAEKAEQGIIELFGSIQASVEQAPVAQEVTQQAAKAETGSIATDSKFLELLSAHQAAELACDQDGSDNNREASNEAWEALVAYLDRRAPTTSTVSASGALAAADDVRDAERYRVLRDTDFSDSSTAEMRDKPWAVYLDPKQPIPTMIACRGSDLDHMTDRAIRTAITAAQAATDKSEG